ncbi:MAG: hypothetical protein N3C12_10505 [Candidatus Binatia bacterium]|nr:hypothetical protein [Candidatus Binatia bacterium]
MTALMDVRCGLAAETLVETPEGPMEIRKVAGKAIPVFTRDATGRVRFRMMRDVQMVATAPVLRLRLENGAWFRAVPSQGVFLASLECVALRDLQPGTVLCAAFHYPAGYRYRTDSGEERLSVAGWQVAAVEADGEAEVFSLHVEPEQCFFVSAGVLLQSA